MGCSKCRYSERGCARCVENFVSHSALRAAASAAKKKTTTTHARANAKTPSGGVNLKTVQHAKTTTSRGGGKKDTSSSSSSRGGSRSSLGDGAGRLAVKTPNARTPANVNNFGAHQRRGRFTAPESGETTTGKKKRQRVVARIEEEEEEMENERGGRQSGGVGVVSREDKENVSPMRMYAPPQTGGSALGKYASPKSERRGVKGVGLPSSSGARVLFEDCDVPSPTPIEEMSPGALETVMSASPSSMRLGNGFDNAPPQSPLAAAFELVHELLHSPNKRDSQRMTGDFWGLGQVSATT